MYIQSTRATRKGQEAVLIYEYKVAGHNAQYAAIDEAIRAVQFIRNKCLRKWMDERGVSRHDLQSYCAVLAREYSFVALLNSQARQASIVTTTPLGTSCTKPFRPIEAVPWGTRKQAGLPCKTLLDRGPLLAFELRVPASPLDERRTLAHVCRGVSEYMCKAYQLLGLWSRYSPRSRLV